MTDDLTFDTQLLLLSDQERAALPEDGRTLLVRLLSWGEVANTPQGLEAFARGAFADSDPTTVLVESQAHGGAIVGRGQALMDDGQGPVLQARISDTTAGRDLLTLYHDGVLTRASVVFKPERSRHRTDGVVERVKASLRKVAILPAGAYPSAQVLEARGDIDMTDQAPEAIVQAPAEPVDLTPIIGRMDGLEEAFGRLEARAAFGGPVQAPSELARFDSFGEAWLAATTDPAVAQELQRVLDDMTTTDIPGLIRPGYLDTIRGMVSLGRRGISAFGGPVGLPAQGMTVEWPQVDDTTAALPDSDFVAEQLTQKAELVSSTVKVSNESVPIMTFGGAVDISWQAIRRSSPSARDAYVRYATIRWAKVTEAAFLAGLVNDGQADTLTMAATDAGRQALVAKLFDLSLLVEAATGLPADVVLAASDVFAKIGKLPGLVPPAYGTQNVQGVAQASTLRVNVSGLEVIHAPQLATGKLIVSNRQAASWGEDGSPFVVQADDVARLGTNVAVWSLGAALTYELQGIRVVTVS